MRGHHDMGGQPAGPVSTDVHELEPWEKRVEALQILLCSPDRGVMTVDELRRGIEEMGAAEYDRCSYFERWIESIAKMMLARGVFTTDELGRAIESIRARERAADGESAP